jgi:hypothetical protein
MGAVLLALLTRRTTGTASLRPGDIEYMLMRRMADASDNQGGLTAPRVAGVVQ